MAIPGWALGLGALMKAPEVTNDWVGLYNNINSIRDDSNASEAMQKLNQLRTSEDVAQFQPDGYLRPATRSTLEKLRQDRLNALLSKESEPTQAEADRLSRMIATDPYIGSEEGLRDFAERPEYWLGAKGSANNPKVAATIRDFGQRNQNILDTFRAGSGDRMALARLTQDKELSGNFKNSTSGVENLDKVDRMARTAEASNKLNQFIAGYDLQPTTESWNGLVNGIRSIPDVSPELVTSTLKDMASRNNAPRGTLRQVVQNGPNSAVNEVRTDMFGEPVVGTSVTSTHNPSDRELGLVSSGGGGDGQLSVAWVDPDGTVKSSRIPRSELPTLKAQLQAQGVKEIDTVDGNRASRRETLIKPAKGRRGLSLPAPSGAAASNPAKGGYTFVNGKLVPN